MISKARKTKLNPMLMNVLLISGAVHVTAILILGGITVVRIMVPDDAQFEEAPAIEESAPEKSVRVEIKPAAAPQESALRNLSMRQVGNIAVEAVDIDLPTMGDSFTISTGLGGFSGGSLLAGGRGRIAIGMSNINIFGIRSTAERVLFMIDASETMLTDEKGGLNSYRGIKDEISAMVGNLSTGTLFNVVFYDNGELLFFKPDPVPAGSEVKIDFMQWIAPINASAGRIGIPKGERVQLTAMPNEPIQAEIPKFQAYSKSNENAYLTQVALEQSIDAVYIIAAQHEGFSRIARDYTPEEDTAWAETVSSRSYQKALQLHEEERVEVQKKAEATLARINADRKKKGQPPRIIDGANLIYQLGLHKTFKNEHPGHRPRARIPGDEVEKYFRRLTRKLYDDRDAEAPTINVILLLAGDERLPEEKEEALEDYTRFFGGKHRIIRGLDEIKSAGSSASTSNP